MYKTKFENIGYHLEYYSNNKYLGFLKLNTYNGICGYASRKKYIADNNIIIGKKKIKKGQEYTTQVIAICGKLNK